MRSGVVVLVVAACGGGQRVTPVDGTGSAGPAETSQKTYAALGARDDAKVVSQAVIFGTDGSASTVLALPRTAQQVVVYAAWTELDAGSATQGVTPIQLTVTPGQNGPPQLEATGSAGPAWHASVWMSAMVAATTLDKDLTDYAFAASSSGGSGHFDGASASALVAAGYLAAMTGATVDASATLMGIVNPDGTLGPVPGVADKLAIALRHGKTRIGFPAGMRIAHESGEPVDLVELARNHGAEAVEVANIHDAYRLLTGKVLPEPVPVAPAAMAVDAATASALSATYTSWLHDAAAPWASVLQLEQAGRLPRSIDHLRDRAKRGVDAAERLRAHGDIAAAYHRLWAAAQDADAAAHAHELVGRVVAGDARGAIAALTELANPGDTRKVFDTIGALKPKTLGGHLQMMAAFEAALRGWGAHAYATRAVAAAADFLQRLDGTSAAELGLPDTEEAIANAIAPAVALSARARVQDQLALQLLEIEKEDSVSYLCSVANMKRLALSFRSAGAAAVDYFDALLLVGQRGGSTDEQKQAFAMVEPTYLDAVVGVHVQDLLQDLQRQWGESSFAWNLLALAATEMAYENASALVAKYYSLGIDLGSDGHAQRLERISAFTSTLAAAERSARQAARGASIAAGAIPVQAKLAYAIAGAERDGDLDDRIDALAQLWVATAYSDTAIMLARN
jgi:uncharacterized protein